MSELTEADRLRARNAVLVDRAANEWRRGRAVLLTDAGLAGVAVAAETLGVELLQTLRGLGDIDLALTLHRANVLHVRTAGTNPVLIPIAARMTAAAIRDLADPTADLANPMRGPFTARRDAPPASAAAAIALAKRARLLPAAVVVMPVGDAGRRWAASEDALALDAEAVLRHETDAAMSLKRVTAARVPLAAAEAAEIVAFRPADGALEHLAIVIGQPDPSEPVLARLHSECFTGDLLGSLRCDCGEQLRGAIAEIQKAGAGVLLYLAQEGRGIGLINKLRAYRLQDQGFDTIEANERLGFEADERLFLPAAEMLRQLGIERVRLLTNNPEKVAGLERCGIAVSERVPHAFPANNHNEAYLTTKKQRSGHYL
jgi:GTP cyclohydrolase II